MKQICKRNPYKDFGQTTPGLDVNIAQALENGDVKSTGVPLQHNNIANPSSVIGKPRDIFEKLDMVDEVNAAIRANRNRNSSQTSGNSSQASGNSSGERAATAADGVHAGSQAGSSAA